MKGTAGKTGQKAVFLDKDGTLVENIPYNVDPSRLRFAPGAARALPRLADRGFRFFIVSNQPGVAQGIFAESALSGLERYLRRTFQTMGAALVAFYYCPHSPAGLDAAPSCQCRKPSAGLFHRAAQEYGIDLPSSWMIGDILDDVEAGHRAGCRAILIDNGGETLWEPGPLRKPEAMARDLDEAASFILAQDSAKAL